MTGYIIVYRDYEGCEIKSLHDLDTVKDVYDKLIATNTQLKDLYRTMVTDNLPNIDNAQSDFFDERSELETQYYDKCDERHIDAFNRYEDPARYCIMRADENGAQCVCAEFGIKGGVIF